MAIVHVRFTFYHPAGYGWSESWYKNSTQPTLKAFYTTSAFGLAEVRAGMLASRCVLETISCSFDPQPKGDSYLRYVNIRGKLPNASEGAPVPTQADAAWTGVLLQFRSGGEAYRKAVFTRGQPDDVVEPNGQILGGAGWPAFQAAADEYILQLCRPDSAWGWIRNAPRAPKSLIEYEPSAGDPRYINLLCAAGTFDAPGDVPTFKRVRIHYPNTKAAINGVWTVQVLSTTAARIITPLSVFPPPGDGVITVYDPEFAPAANGDIQKSTRRAPGRPLLRTPGRKGNRPRG